jgi:hypothetical protein
VCQRRCTVSGGLHEQLLRLVGSTQKDGGFHHEAVCSGRRSVWKTSPAQSLEQKGNFPQDPVIAHVSVVAQYCFGIGHMWVFELCSRHVGRLKVKTQSSCCLVISVHYLVPYTRLKSKCNFFIALFLKQFQPQHKFSSFPCQNDTSSFEAESDAVRRRCTCYNRSVQSLFNPRNRTNL